MVLKKKKKKIGLKHRVPLKFWTITWNLEHYTDSFDVSEAAYTLSYMHAITCTVRRWF